MLAQQSTCGWLEYMLRNRAVAMPRVALMRIHERKRATSDALTKGAVTPLYRL